MSNQRWTPGKWSFREISGDDGLGYIESDTRVPDICHAGVSDLPADENRANARLMAAGPEMIAALRLCRDSVDPDHVPAHVRLAVDAAITKAERGTS